MTKLEQLRQTVAQMFENATEKEDIERLAKSRTSLNTPLVLHGGSGLSDDDFKNTIIVFRGFPYYEEADG